MSAESIAAKLKHPRYLLVAIVLVMVAASTPAQVPTPEQLNALKTLPADQQQQLIQTVLGKGDGTNRKVDPKLDMGDQDQ